MVRTSSSYRHHSSRQVMSAPSTLSRPRQAPSRLPGFDPNSYPMTYTRPQAVTKMRCASAKRITSAALADESTRMSHNLTTYAKDVFSKTLQQKHGMRAHSFTMRCTKEQVPITTMTPPNPKNEWRPQTTPASLGYTAATGPTRTGSPIYNPKVRLMNSIRTARPKKEPEPYNHLRNCPATTIRDLMQALGSRYTVLPKEMVSVTDNEEGEPLAVAERRLLQFIPDDISSTKDDASVVRENPPAAAEENPLVTQLSQPGPPGVQIITPGDDDVFIQVEQATTSLDQTDYLSDNASDVSVASSGKSNLSTFSNRSSRPSSARSKGSNKSNKSTKSSKRSPRASPRGSPITSPRSRDIPRRSTLNSLSVPDGAKKAGSRPSSGRRRSSSARSRAGSSRRKKSSKGPRHWVDAVSVSSADEEEKSKRLNDFNNTFQAYVTSLSPPEAAESKRPVSRGMQSQQRPKSVSFRLKPEDRLARNLADSRSPSKQGSTSGKLPVVNVEGAEGEPGQGETEVDKPEPEPELPEFICPFSVSKSKEVGVKQWLCAHSFSTIAHPVPVM